MDIFLQALDIYSPEEACVRIDLEVHFETIYKHVGTQLRAIDFANQKNAAFAFSNVPEAHSFDLGWFGVLDNKGWLPFRVG